MKKWILFIATILTLCSSVARADDFDDGLEAYRKGNYAKAIELLRPLAAKGNGSAQFYLGNMYSDGNGVTQDYKEAIKWYRLGAEQGNATAQANLGFMYHKGKGITQNHQEAVKWFRLAAEQGEAKAQYSLSAMYINGKGAIQDYVRAQMWMNLAASKGAKKAKENRDILAKEMTLSQIAEAQKMARDCEKKNYRNCE